MSEFRLSPEAEAELDEIWLYTARGSGSVDTANRVIDDITDSLWALARHPYIGRRRDHDLRPGLRTFASGPYVIVHRIAENEVVLILHIVHGKRDIDSLLNP
jgi:toxin ParE1/3/4